MLPSDVIALKHARSGAAAAEDEQTPNPYQPSARQVGRSSPSGRRVKKTRDRKR
jgi:hypothetical protein